MKTYLFLIITCFLGNTTFAQNSSIANIAGTYTGFPTNLNLDKSRLPKFKIVLNEDSQFSLSVLKGENWKEEMKEITIKDNFESNFYQFKFDESSELENMSITVFSEATKVEQEREGVEFILLGKDGVKLVLDMIRTEGKPAFKKEADPFLDIVGYYEGVQFFGDTTGEAGTFEITSDYGVKWEYTDGETWYVLEFSIEKNTFAYDDKGNLALMFNPSDEQLKSFSLMIPKEDQSPFKGIGVVLQAENASFFYDVNRKGGNPVLKNYTSIVKLSPLSIVRINLVEEIKKLSQLEKYISTDISTIYALPKETALFNRKMMLEQFQKRLEDKRETLTEIQGNLNQGLERTAEKNCPKSKTAITNATTNIEKSLVELDKGMVHLDKLLAMENMDSYMFYFNEMIEDFIEEGKAMILVIDGLTGLKDMRDECN